jgi:hypothetical protein
VDSWVFLSNEARLEEELWASESLVGNGENLSVGELICLFVGRGLFILFYLSVIVEGNIGEFFLNVSDDFLFSGGGEGHTLFHYDFAQPFSTSTSGKI